MATGSVTQDTIDLTSKVVCLPLMLVLNLSLVEYLALVFASRIQEKTIQLLLVCAFLGFAVQVPFASPNQTLVRHLNDISESCSVLTFLIQIIIVARDLEHRIRLKLIHWSMRLAEALVVLDCAVIFADLVEMLLFNNDASIQVLEVVGIAVQTLNLVFVMVFRFFYLANVNKNGFWAMISQRKCEVAAYLAFCTHEIPFAVLQSCTPFNLEYFQGLWHRLTLTICILLTVRSKKRQVSSSASKNATTTPNNSVPGTLGRTESCRGELSSSVPLDGSSHPSITMSNAANDLNAYVNRPSVSSAQQVKFQLRALHNTRRSSHPFAIPPNRSIVYVHSSVTGQQIEAITQAMALKPAVIAEEQGSSPS